MQDKTNAVYKTRKGETWVLCLDCYERMKLGMILFRAEWTDQKCKVCRRPFDQRA